MALLAGHRQARRAGHRTVTGVGDQTQFREALSTESMVVLAPGPGALSGWRCYPGPSYPASAGPQFAHL